MKKNLLDAMLFRLCTEYIKVTPCSPDLEHLLDQSIRRVNLKTIGNLETKMIRFLEETEYGYKKV